MSSRNKQGIQIKNWRLLVDFERRQSCKHRRVISIRQPLGGRREETKTWRIYSPTVSISTDVHLPTYQIHTRWFIEFTTTAVDVKLTALDQFEFEFKKMWFLKLIQVEDVNSWTGGNSPHIEAILHGHGNRKSEIDSTWCRYIHDEATALLAVTVCR